MRARLYEMMAKFEDPYDDVQARKLDRAAAGPLRRALNRGL
jgi:hypothetical protein